MPRLDLLHESKLSVEGEVTKAQPAKQAGATSVALGDSPVPHVVTKAFSSPHVVRN